MKLLTTAELLIAAVAPAQAAFSWSNVHIGGGGGFIPGIVFHPNTKGVAYARADVGGLYRMNSDNSWTPVTDTLATDANWHDWGIDAVALDPQNSDVVYAAVGMYTNSWDPNDGSIIKSTDSGSTWTSTSLSFKVGGNMPGRGMGERLAVDPANSDIIYFGARSENGLWKSTDGGSTFSKVTSFTAKGSYAPDPSDTTGYNSDPQGCAFVTFDSTSGTTGGATSRIFVGTADNTTDSVWVSEDAGSTWSGVSGQPGTYFPHKAVLQPSEKALYLTYSDGTGPYDGTNGSVWRYDITAASWDNITPVSGAADLYFGFGGMGVDMLKPGTIVVAALNSWYPNAQLWRSTDSGSSWSPIWEWTSYPNMNNYYSISAPLAPWIGPQTLGDTLAEENLGWMIEALVIDPFDSDHWLYGTGLTIFGGTDLTSWDTVHNITIQSLANGIEEMAVQALASAPGGSELFVAVGDDSGFTFASSSDLETSPAINWETPDFSTTPSVDYAGLAVANVVRVGNSAGTQQVAMSNDGGNSWYAYSGAGDTMYGGTVAISASGTTIVWSTATNGVQVSSNSASFTSVSGLPATAYIASDKGNNTVFYGGFSSTFYVSTNTGSSFSAGGALTGASTVNDVIAHPKKAGEVWVSTDVGVFRSTNYGASFTKTSTALTNVYAIALGLGSGSTWNVYAFGTGADGNRLYGSSDTGATWVDIQGSTQGFGAIDSCKLAGSANVANQVYVGTNGRGVFYASGTISGGTGTSSSTSIKTSTTLSTTTKATTTTAKSGTTTTTITKSSTTTTTIKTTTKTATSATSSPTSTGTVAAYGQCGGAGYTGPTTCVSGYTCTEQNEYYSQCVAS
ncbi:glycoside hydrolase family 74 protein [Xylariaceae sp. FL0255]|nr:glycoside hydrolase family 74 protein [Xylariaceae sp. FL0255]